MESYLSVAEKPIEPLNSRYQDHERVFQTDFLRYSSVVTFIDQLTNLGVETESWYWHVSGAQFLIKDAKHMPLVHVAYTCDSETN